MIQFLPKYKAVISKTKEYVKHAFLACDLDGNGMCDEYEFKMICKHIESDHLSKEDVEKIFENEADLLD